MKSIKRGRGPSMMSGIMGILVAAFGVVWTIIALSIGGGLFAIFGIVFVAIAIVQTVFSFKNATGDNRYSEFDITDDGEEPDPLNQYFKKESSPEQNTDGGAEYCPYCGAKAGIDYAYCRKCGRKL